MADPTIVNWITLAAKKYGADPVAMLADSIVENGARAGLTPGDNNSSFGYFQMHRGGALGSHSPQWATTRAVAENRAKEFARLQVHGGKGAAAVQRPLDRAGYAKKVDAALAEARRILGQSAGTPGSSGAASGGAAPAASVPNYGRTIAQTISGILNAKTPTAALGQYQAGLPRGTIDTTPATDPLLTTSGASGPAGKAIHGGKVIGTPGQGTHAKAFNIKGGSDNWESENAVDVATPVHTPVYAVSDGTIGSQIGSLGSGGRFAGLRLHLQVPGNELYYAHLSQIVVKSGQRVHAGQLLGYSGEANGVAHLHLATKVGSPARYA